MLRRATYPVFQQNAIVRVSKRHDGKGWDVCCHILTYLLLKWSCRAAAVAPELRNLHLQQQTSTAELATTESCLSLDGFLSTFGAPRACLWSWACRPFGTVVPKKNSLLSVHRKRGRVVPFCSLLSPFIILACGNFDFGALNMYIALLPKINLRSATATPPSATPSRCP